jgi:hypothetical protein
MNLVSERGQLCPPEPVSPNSWTRLSALLSVAGSWSQCMRKSEREISCSPHFQQGAVATEAGAE